MPKLLSLNEFASKGLNSDLMPWDLPGSFLTEISNIRISRHKLSPFGGQNTWATLPVDFDPGYLMPVITDSASYWLIAGDTVQVFDGSIFTDVSNVAGYAGVTDVDLWTGCMLSRIPVINNPGSYPEYWSPQSPATPMQYLPWDSGNNWQQANQICKIIRSHKQFLFALDLVDNGTEIPDGVRWSAPADVAGVPATWDELDTTNVAGLVNLGGDGGAIVDGLSLRDSFVVYRENGITVFDYVGGNFVWQIRHLDTGTGLISPDSIVQVRGNHYFIGDGDILMNDGNSIRSLIHNRIKKRFVSNFDSDNYKNSYAVENSANNEIWFCVPETGSTYPNVAYIYNWLDDSWSVRSIPEAPMSAYGSKANPAETWATISGTWEDNQGIWNQRSLTPLSDTVIMATKPAGAGQSGSLLALDEGLVGSSVTFDSNFERLGFALEGLNNVTTITRIYPHMRGPGSVYIRLGSQDYPGAPVRWKDAVLFDPTTDRKVDIRTTGELHCFRVYSVDSSDYWEISGIDVEYTNAGMR